MTRRKRVGWRGEGVPTVADRMSVFRDMSGFFLLEVEQAQERAKRMKRGPAREQVEKVLKCALAAGLATEEWRKRPGEEEAVRAAKFLSTVPGVAFAALGWYVSPAQKAWSDRLAQLTRDSLDLLEDLADLSPYARPIAAEVDPDSWR